MHEEPISMPYLRDERNRAYLQGEAAHIIGWYTSPRLPLYAVLFGALVAGAALLWWLVKLPEIAKLLVVLIVIIAFTALAIFSRERGAIEVTNREMVRDGTVTDVVKLYRRGITAFHIYYHFQTPEGKPMQGQHILADSVAQQVGVPEIGQAVVVLFRNERDFDLL